MPITLGSSVPTTAPYPHNPLIMSLWEHAHTTPHATALCFITGPGPDAVTEWTWEEFLAGIHTAQQELRASGITFGDRVLLILSASPNYLLTSWGLIALGAQPVSVPLTPEAPLAPGFTTLCHIAANCDATVLVTTPAKADELAALLVTDAAASDTAALAALTILTPTTTKPPSSPSPAT